MLDVTVAVDDAALGGNPDDTAAMSITVTDVNEPPTTTGLSNIRVDEDASDTVIDLTGSLANPEDGAGGLTYSVQSDTNPALFSQVDIQAGTLTLDYAANAYGTADIVVRGTDSGGLWVESTFSVVVNPEPDTLTWTNAAAHGDWNSPGNWDLGIVPENEDTVIRAFEGAAGTGVGLSDALSGEAGQLSAEAAENLQTLKEATEYLHCGH